MGLPALGIKRFSRARNTGGCPFCRASRRAGLSIDALQVCTVEVVPAPGVKTSTLRGAVTVVVVRCTVVTGQRGALFGQVSEHPFAAADVGLAVEGRHRIQAQGVKRVTFRRDQVPAPVALFGAKKTGGIKCRPFERSTISVLLGALGQPGAELLLFLGCRRLELCVAGDPLGPFGPRRLTVTIDDRSIYGVDHALTVLYPKTFQQNALGCRGLRDRQGHGHHLTAIDLALATRQQDALTLDRHGHWRAGTHALCTGRIRLEWQQQRLRRPCGQVDTAGEGLAVIALHRHIKRERPVHGVLQTQGHHSRLRPVPHTGLRG